jgi:O6-methylguanine-DNA--protein-cysteine methyltransferase
VSKQNIIDLVHKLDEIDAELEHLSERRADLIRDRAEIDQQLERFANGTKGASPIVQATSTAATIGALPESGNITARVLATVAALPPGRPMDYGEVAKAIYGEDNENTRKKLRSTLATLQVRERIKNTGRNRWEVIGA